MFFCTIYDFCSVLFLGFFSRQHIRNIFSMLTIHRVMIFAFCLSVFVVLSVSELSLGFIMFL